MNPKFMKTKDKNTHILKAVREKCNFTRGGKMILMTADCSSEAMEVIGRDTTFPKCLKKGNRQSKFHIQ